MAVMQQCPQDNKDKMARIVTNLKTVSKGTKLGQPFMEPLQQVMVALLPIFNANCGSHEPLTKQIIYYVQSNIALFGAEIIPLLTNFSAMCCSRLPFEHLEDSISMLIVAIQSFKKQGL